MAKYGERLVCVRYRYDERRQRRFKTVELMVESSEWLPEGTRVAGGELVSLRVGWEELDLRSRVKAAGRAWDPVDRVWRLSAERVAELGSERRIGGRDLLER